VNSCQMNQDLAAVRLAFRAFRRSFCQLERFKPTPKWGSS